MRAIPQSELQNIHITGNGKLFISNVSLLHYDNKYFIMYPRFTGKESGFEGEANR